MARRDPEEIYRRTLHVGMIGREFARAYQAQLEKLK